MHTDYVVLAGRYAPICTAHLALVREQLEKADRVAVLVTGADAARSNRIPWTAKERLDMCRMALAEFADRIDFSMRDDHPYDQIAEAQAMRTAVDAGVPRESGLSGLDPKGGSYLYRVADEALPDEARGRDAFFTGDDTALKACVPDAVFDSLQSFRQADWFAGLAEEYRYVDAYKTSWLVAPYPPIFVTVDMFIEHQGRLLLIRRGGQPGRGLWALPGGFVDGNETLDQAALRELREETGLELGWDSPQVTLKARHVFDDPQRSARGHTITHAFHVELSADETPVVVGGDDAETARWVPIDELPAFRGQFFEDHGHMIDYFLKP